MATNTVNAQNGQGIYYISLNLSEQSYSIENNTSVVHWSLEFGRNNTAGYASGKMTFSAVVNGVQVYNATQSLTVSANQNIRIAEGTITVPHDTDGGKYVGGSASISPGFSNAWFPASGSVNVGFSLTKIPRSTEPKVDLSAGTTLGSTIKLSGTAASSSFNHRFKYSLNNGTAVSIQHIPSGSASISVDWTIPLELAEQITTSTIGSVSIILDTYSGDTFVGSKSVSINVYIPKDYVPSIDSVSIEEGTEGIADIFGVYIQRESTLKFTVTASGSNGSTVKNIDGKIDGENYIASNGSFTTNVIFSNGSVPYTITVTDSRGRTATKSGTVDILEYSTPSLTNLAVKRANSEYEIDENDGIFGLFQFSYRVSPLNNKNTVSFTIEYRDVDSDSWISLNEWTDPLELNGLYRGGDIFETIKSYYVRFGIKDYFMDEYRYVVVTVSTTYTLINWGAGGKSMALGMQSSDDETFEVAMPVIFYGSSFNISTEIQKQLGMLFNPVGTVVSNTTGVNPEEYLGGTWEQFAQGRTLVGVGTGDDGVRTMTFAAGAEGGEYKHKLTSDENGPHNHSLTGGDGHSWSWGRANSTVYANVNVYAGSATDNYLSSIQNDWNNTRSSGVGAGHDNVQPYVAVYYWRRIA